jgi:hypothetical protein
LWRDYKGRFDPADFIVPPELEKGKSQRVQCYIQSAHYRLLNIIARSGHFPFEERNDVVRWCIQYGLEHIDSLEPTLTRSVMSQANMMNHRLQEQVYHETHLKWLNMSKVVVFGYVNAGDVDAAREEVAWLWTETMKMPEEPDRALRWKLKYLDSLKENFAVYLPEEERT